MHRLTPRYILAVSTHHIAVAFNSALFKGFLFSGDIFKTISSFLITSLALSEREVKAHRFAFDLVSLLHVALHARSDTQIQLEDARTHPILRHI